MPVGVWVAVTVVTGVCSGLLGTLVKVRHERGEELRHHCLEAIEQFALEADRWFEMLRTAIAERWEHDVDAASSQPAFDAAVDAVAQARSEVNRMHAILPSGSRTALAAYRVGVCLETALDSILRWPPDEDEIDDDNTDYSEWSGDDEYHPLYTPMREEIDEAYMWQRFGLEAFGSFVQIAPVELRGGLRPAIARAVRLPARGWRRVRRSIQSRRSAREHRKVMKEIEARRAELKQKAGKTAGG